MLDVTKVFHSIDSLLLDINDADPKLVQLPAKYLQSLDCSSLQSSRLSLKVGDPLLLHHNLYPSEGFCNRIRILVIQLVPRCIVAQILDGNYNEQYQLISCIFLSTLQGELAFMLTHK